MSLRKLGYQTCGCGRDSGDGGGLMCSEFLNSDSKYSKCLYFICDNCNTKGTFHEGHDCPKKKCVGKLVGTTPQDD